jgi:predicted Zn-dependent protease with MMP-like domain
VSAGEQADQQSIEHAALADDDALDLGVQRIESGAQVADLAVDFLDVNGHGGTSGSGNPVVSPILDSFAAIDNAWAGGQHDNMKRLSLRRFGQIVAQVMETLPEEFQPYLDNVVVDVEEEPDEKTLRRAGFTDEEIDAGDTLFGLFDPLELPTLYSGDAVDVNDVLHRLVIFKNPLEDEFPNRRQLLIEIRKTVIHELAHHFGWSDRDLERFDENPNPFEGK